MTLTEKVGELAEEVKYCWGEWIVSPSSYDGQWNDWLTQVKAACREYSGILRGIISLWEDLGVEYYGETHLLEAIDTWKQVFEGAKDGRD